MSGARSPRSPSGWIATFDCGTVGMPVPVPGRAEHDHVAAEGLVDDAAHVTATDGAGERVAGAWCPRRRRVERDRDCHTATAVDADHHAELSDAAAIGRLVGALATVSPLVGPAHSEALAAAVRVTRATRDDHTLVHEAATVGASDLHQQRLKPSRYPRSTPERPVRRRCVGSAFDLLTGVNLAVDGGLADLSRMIRYFTHRRSSCPTWERAFTSADSALRRRSSTMSTRRFCPTFVELECLGSPTDPAFERMLEAAVDPGRS